MSESRSEPSASESSVRRRLLKWGGGLVGGVAVLVLAAALILPRLFTSEQLKGYVVPPLEEATGRQVEIDAIGLRVLPAPAIRVDGFRLANAEGYGPAPAVEARTLSVDVALWPLFVGRLRPTAVGLEAPVIRYEVAADGATNFDDLGGDPADTTAAEEPLLGGIPLSNVRVSAAQLHYADRSTGQSLRLDFDAQLGVLPEDAALASDGTVDLRSVQALLPEVGPDTLQVRDAQLVYDVRVAPSAGTVDVRTLRLTTAPFTLTANGALTALHEQPTLDLTFETGNTDLGRIASFVPAAAGEGFNPQGSLSLNGTVKGTLPDEGSPMDSLSVAAAGRLTGAGVDYQGRSLLRAVSADLDLSLDSVTARGLQGQLLGASLAGTAAIRGLRATPQMDLDLQTGSMNLADLVAFVPPEQRGDYNPQGTLRLDARATGPIPSDATALQQLAIDGTGQLGGFGVDYEGRGLLRDLRADLTFSADAVSARGLQGQLLGASLTGNAAVRQFRSEPQMDLDLQTGSMNLADLVAFVPPEQRGDYNPQGTLRLDATASGPLPTEAASLQRLAVNGTGQLDGFGVDYGGQALLRSLAASLRFSGTTASAQGIDGQLLGRPLAGTVTVRDLRGTPQVEGQLAGSADLAQLSSLASDDPASVQGIADYDVGFSGPLQEPDALRPNGRVRLTKVQVPYETFRHPLDIPEATLQLTGTGLSADAFSVRSGPQTATLQATLRNLFPISKGLSETDPALSATFTFTADRLDLVALYPEAQASDVYYSQLFAAHLAGANVNGKSADAVAETLYGDVELPAYAVEGRVEIDTLLNEPQRFDDLTMDVQMDDRRLVLRNLSAQTYGGTLAGSLTLDQRGASTSAAAPPGTVHLASTRPAPASSVDAAPPSTLTYDFELQEARAGAVLRDWTRLGELVTGTLTFDVDGDAALTDGLLPETTAFTAIGQSIVADGGLSLDLGPANALANALKLPTGTLKQFQRLGGPFAIRDGQFQVKTWTFGGAQFDGTLQGALGFGGGLDLEMTLNLPLSLIQNSGIAARLDGGDGRLGGVLKKLLGPAGDETVPVTVRFGGTMRDPTVQILNRDAIRARIEALAKEEGLNLLRNFFGGGGGK